MSFPNGVRLSDSIASKIIEGGFPSDLDGLRFSAALNIWEFVPFGGGGGLTFARVVKTVDEIVNNSIVLQDDNEIFAAIAADTWYGFMLILNINSNAADDFRLAFSVPGTPNVNSGYARQDANGIVLSAIAAVFIQGTVTATNMHQGFWGHVRTDTPGNFILQWAQGTANARDTILRGGSYFVMWREA